MPEDTGGSAATRVQVTIDDTPLFVRTFDGGHPKADVVTILTGDGSLPVKHISTLKFEPMSWEMSLPLGKPMLQAVNAFMGNQAVRKGGSVAFGDAKLEVRSHLDFRKALMTAFGFPGLDASSKDTGYFTVSFRPEETTRRAGDKKKLQGAAGVKQKAFMRSNFRISIGDLPTKRVTKIDAMTFTMKVQEHGGVRRRFPELVATTIEYPNLVLTIAEADSPKWEEWFDDFAIHGNSGSDNELSGRIEYLAPNAKDVLATIELSHIGIFEIRRPAAEGDKDQAATFAASMYFEGATLTIGVTE
jgi:hypothetical protein